MNQSDSVAVIDKAIDLLESLGTVPNQTVAELSEATGVSKATAYRILATLERRGYVTTYDRVRRYSIGHAFQMYSNAARPANRLLAVARPAMEGLWQAVGETVNLGVVAGGGVLYLDAIESSQSLRAAAAVGTLDTLHSTALGKAILSRMPAGEREGLLADAVLVGRTAHTVTDPGQLRRSIERAAQEGYAIDDEENEIGMRCVAAPIVNADGWPIAAISVSGPSSRMSNAVIQALRESLRLACDEIATGLTEKRP